MKEKPSLQKPLLIASAAVCLILALLLGLQSWSAKNDPPGNDDRLGNQAQTGRESAQDAERRNVRNRQTRQALSSSELETRLLAEIFNLSEEDFKNNEVASKRLLINPDTSHPKPEYLEPLLDLLDRTDQDNLAGLIAVLESPHIKNLPGDLNFLVARLACRKRGEFLSDFEPGDQDGFFEMLSQVFTFEGFARNNNEDAIGFLKEADTASNFLYASSMTEHLAKHDPAAALDYIATIESSRVRELAVKSLARILTIEGGEEADIWLSRIEDPKLINAANKTVEKLEREGLVDLN